jgi:integrase
MAKLRAGYRVRRQKNRPGWLAEVWTGAKYVSKSHPSHQAAVAWAQAQRSLVVAGADISKVVADSQRLGTRGLGRQYMDYLRTIGRGDSHLKVVMYIMDSFAEAVPDLRAPDVGAATELWLNALTLKRDPATSMAPTTRNKYLIMARGLIRYATRRGLLDKDPTRAIDYTTVPEYLAPQFTIEELRRCLRQTHYKTWRDMRKGDKPKLDPYHLLFAVLLYGGLRFQEAAFIRWEDFDFSGDVIMVRLDTGAKVKRQRERLVPLQLELKAMLMPIRKPSGHLFKGRVWNASRGFRAFLTRAGVTPGDRTPHACRHTYAGVMTATGIPSALLSAYLGHTNAQTTMGYTRLAARYVTAVAGWPRGELRVMAT